jgi:hypothetical protein
MQDGDMLHAAKIIMHFLQGSFDSRACLACILILHAEGSGRTIGRKLVPWETHEENLFPKSLSRKIELRVMVVQQ